MLTPTSTELDQIYGSLLVKRVYKYAPNSEDIERMWGEKNASCYFEVLQPASTVVVWSSYWFIVSDWGGSMSPGVRTLFNSLPFHQTHQRLLTQHENFGFPTNLEFQESRRQNLLIIPEAIWRKRREWAREQNPSGRFNTSIPHCLHSRLLFLLPLLPWVFSADIPDENEKCRSFICVWRRLKDWQNPDPHTWSFPTPGNDEAALLCSGRVRGGGFIWEGEIQKFTPTHLASSGQPQCLWFTHTKNILKV